jgi:putative transposase
MPFLSVASRVAKLVTFAIQMAQSTGSSKRDALDILRMLKRHFDKGVTIHALAEETGLSERTFYRAIRSFKSDGVQGLQRNPRSDKGSHRKISDDVKKAIEGLCLRDPKPPIAWVCREIEESCRQKNLPAPGYWIVLDIYRKLDERLKTLAHKGDKAYEQEFDPLLLREAKQQNDIWQCDHKDLKIWAVDENGKIGKVWITAILDDYSRMIPGYFLSITAPNSMKIATALRQAIWAKEDKRWPVAGIPEVFYSDHGPDFMSSHIEIVAADLGMQLVNTIVFKPRGRGKIERFFRTLVQMFCPSHKSSKVKPKSFSEIESAFREWLDNYHHRKHSELKVTPIEKWSTNGFLPRLPESLEALDLMLMKVAKPRTMRGEGIRFNHKRYSHELLTESNGQQFDIRYDPRDLSHIWVYGEGGALVCKANSMGLHPTKEETEQVISGRKRVKKRLKKDLKDKQTAGEDFIQKSDPNKEIAKKIDKQPLLKLRKHFHERD